MSDVLFRGICVAMALVLALAPHRKQIEAVVRRYLEACVQKAGVISRASAICLLIVAALYGKLPSWNFAQQSLPVAVSTPSPEMQSRVAAVSRAMANANHVDRAIWASVWEKAAVVVSAPEGAEPVFTDTRALRGFTVLSLDIAWRRIGGHSPGDVPGLRDAVEKAFAGVVGLDVRPVTPELRAAYAEACQAIAWAGYGRG